MQPITEEQAKEIIKICWEFFSDNKGTTEFEIIDYLKKKKRIANIDIDVYKYFESQIKAKDKVIEVAEDALKTIALYLEPYVWQTENKSAELCLQRIKTAIKYCEEIK